MTRDEQIAQLKPGDKVIVRTSHQAGLEQALFWERRGDWFVYRYDDRYSAQLYCRRLSDLILPEPPPKPKAVPGVRYRTTNIVSAANPGGGGSIDYHYIGVGLISRGWPLLVGASARVGATRDMAVQQVEEPMTPTRADLNEMLRPHWLIRDGHTGYWWRPKGGGYTSDLMQAGLYSEEEARRTESPAYADRRDKAVCLADYVDVIAASPLAALLTSEEPAQRPETPTVGTCATCRHFRPYTADYGACISTEAYDKGCSAEVEASFGCILHAPLPDAPKEPTPA